MVYVVTASYNGWFPHYFQIFWGQELGHSCSPYLPVTPQRVWCWIWRSDSVLKSTHYSSKWYEFSQLPATLAAGTPTPSSSLLDSCAHVTSTHTHNTLTLTFTHTQIDENGCGYYEHSIYLLSKWGNQCMLGGYSWSVIWEGLWFRNIEYQEA